MLDQETSDQPDCLCPGPLDNQDVSLVQDKELQVHPINYKLYYLTSLNGNLTQALQQPPTQCALCLTLIMTLSPTHSPLPLT